MSDHLIRRDVPLPKGTRIEVHVTSVYSLTLDDDWFDGEETLDFRGFEKALGEDHDDRVHEVEHNYDRHVSDIDFYLPAPPGDYRTFRFERRGEDRFARSEQYVDLDSVLAKERA